MKPSPRNPRGAPDSKANRDALAKLKAERLAEGVCRHCGGAIPCWSPWGDKAVGVRNDA